MKEIYFIRHGETEWNKLGLGQGSRNDIELNDAGEEQALLTGKYLKEYRQLDKNFDLIISSPMMRAKKTAEIICDQLEINHSDITYDPILIERDSGLLAIGKTHKEMKLDPFYDLFFSYLEKYESIIDPIQKSQYTVEFDEMCHQNYEYETSIKFMNRLKIFIDFLKITDKMKIIVISHGATISHLLKIMLNIASSCDSLKADNKHGNNCHITYVTFKDETFTLMSGPTSAHFKIFS